MKESYIEQTDNDHFSARDQLSKYFRDKWLFLASFIFCFAVCLLVIKTSMPLYGIYASIVIKDEKKGEASDFLFRDIDVFGEQNAVDNESEIIRSKTAVSAVVQKMALNINYFYKDGLLSKKAINYENPVLLATRKETEELYETPLEIQLIDAVSYKLPGKDKTFRYGETAVIPEGEFVIYKTDRFDSTEYKEITISIKSLNETAQKLRSKISVTQTSKNASMLNLALLHPVPAQGADILNAIIEEYNKNNNEYREAQTAIAVNIIQERLNLLANQLDEIENDRERYKSRMGITDLSADAQSFLNRAREVDNSITEAEINKEALQFIEDFARSDGSPMPPTTGLNDPVLLGMLTRISGLELEKSELTGNLGPENENVKIKARQIAEIRNSILDNIRVQKQNVQSTLDQLVKEKRRIDSGIRTVPINERNLTKIVREKNIHENIFNYLLQKREEAKISTASDYSKLRIVDASYSSPKPVKPDKLIILFAGLLISLILPIVIIYVREGLNDKVYFPVQTDALGAELLGEISVDKRPDPVQFMNNGRSFVAEQFRMMAAKLRREEPGSKSVLITSSLPGEGKSYVSIRFAETLASWGYKTVLIDLDLRKGKFTSDLRLKSASAPGLSDYLTSGCSIQEALRQVNYLESCVDTISVGAKPLNKFILSDSARLTELFSYLRANYEFIIINTPPAGLVSDVFLLARHADVCLYIIRNKVTLKRNLRYISELNRKNTLGKMYIVLNGAPDDLEQNYREYRGYFNVKKAGKI